MASQVKHDHMGAAGGAGGDGAAVLPMASQLLVLEGRADSTRLHPLLWTHIEAAL